MGVKEFYYRLEDGYYNFLDKVNKVIPVYSIIDPIDRVFPSFVLVSLLLVGFLAGIVFLVLSNINLFSGGDTIAFVKVTDPDSVVLSGVPVRIELEGRTEPVLLTTDARGVVSVNLGAATKQATIVIEKDGFVDFRETFSLVAGRTRGIRLTREIASFGADFDLLFKDRETNLLIDDQSLSLSFSCSGSQVVPLSTIVTDGTTRLHKDSACERLFVNVVPSADYYDSLNVEVLNSPQSIFLDPIPVPSNGFLDVNVVNDQNRPVANARVTVSTVTQPSLQQNTTTAAGVASFELAVGSFTVTAVVPSDGRTASGSATVRANETTRLRLNVGTAPQPGNERKVALRVVDANGGEAIANATVVFYRETVALATLNTTASGVVEQPVVAGTGIEFSAVVSHPSYLLKVIRNVTVRSVSDSNANLVRLDRRISTPPNFGEAVVTVSSVRDPRVEGARVWFFQQQYPNPLLGPMVTARDGNAVFTNLEPSGAPYYATATKDSSSGTSETKSIGEGERVSFAVRLGANAGNFRLVVRDANSNALVQGASVQAFVLENNSRIAIGSPVLTDANGVAVTQPFSTDRRISFEVSKTGFVPTRTLDSQPVAEQTVDLGTVLLVPVSVPQPDVSLRWVSVLDAASNEEATILETGRAYWAVFYLTLANTSAHAHSAVHVEAGLHDADHESVEQNPVFITNFQSASIPATPVFSSRLDRADIFSNPVPVNAGEPAKMVNATWSSLPAPATYELRVRFETIESARPDTNIWFFFLARTDVNSTSLLSKTLAIGQPVCSFHCPSFVWRFGVAPEGSTTFRLLDDVPRPVLRAEQAYALQFIIYNLTSTTVSNATVTFSPTDRSVIQGVSSNRVANISLPPGRFESASNQHWLFRSLVAAVDGSLVDVNLSRVVSDLSHQSSFRLYSEGVRPLQISTSTNAYNFLVVNVKDGNAVPLEAARVRYAVASCDTNVDSFVFPSSALGGLTNASGAFATGQVLSSGTCVMVEASKAEYRTARLLVIGSQGPQPSDEWSCIVLDADPVATGIQSLREVRRNSTIEVALVSVNCPIARVRVASLGDLVSNDEIRLSFPNGDASNILLNSNETKLLSVNITPSAPLGFIPLLAYPFDPADVPTADEYSSLIELVVVPTTTEPFGVVED